MEKLYPKVADLVKKVNQYKEKTGVDLSSGEDLSIGLMNLISIEEHLYFSAMKTGKETYLDILLTVREMRKNLLKQIVKDPEGEVWCISKHLLASSMRLMEVGTKYLEKDKNKAYLMFKNSFELYSLFWALNMDLVKKEAASESFKEDIKKDGFKSGFSAAIKKLIDCCKE